MLSLKSINRRPYPYFVGDKILWLDALAVDQMNLSNHTTELRLIDWYSSDGALNANQPTDNNKPALVNNSLNALRGVRFGSGSLIRRMNITSFESATSNKSHIQIFGVFQRESTSGQGTTPTFVQWSCNGSTNYKIGFLVSFTTADRYQFGGRRQASDSFLSVVSDTNAGLTARIVCGSLDYSTGNAYLYQDGVLVGHNSSFHSSNTESGNASEALLGARASTQRLSGLIHEMIMTNADQWSKREAIEGYLAHKWGLASSLPPAHPYKVTPP